MVSRVIHDRAMGQMCSMCGVPVEGANVLYAPDGRVVCPACFAKLAPIGPPSRAPWRMFAGAGAVVGVIPFALHMSTSSSTTVNGHVTNFVYRDWIAVGCGVVAILIGLIAIVAARKEQLQRGLAFMAGICVVLLGGMQIARGLGVFETPGETADSSSSVTIIDHEATVPEKPKGDPNSPDTCDGDDCFDLGLKLEKTDPAGSTKAFMRACDAGAMGGCYNVGFDYAHREPPDMAKAVTYYKKGCDNGHARSCNELGLIAMLGQAGDKDPAQAKALWEKSCDGGDGQACGNLGIMYDGGKGVTEDKAKAREMYEKGCFGVGDENSDKQACYNTGVDRSKGIGGPADIDGAIEAYDRACKAGEDDACSNLEKVKARAKKK
jgi:uncharacterized protein